MGWVSGLWRSIPVSQIIPHPCPCLSLCSPDMFLWTFDLGVGDRAGATSSKFNIYNSIFFLKVWIIATGMFTRACSIEPINYLIAVWWSYIWPSILKDMLRVYAENCLSCKIVAAGLRNSHRDIHNWKTDRPSLPVEVVTGVAVSQLEITVRVDRRVRISNAVDTIGCWQGVSIQNMHDWLHFEKRVAGGFPEM
jgi:hypothetical protein